MNHAITIDSFSDLNMSSREIAELTGKRHDNVMRDITVMLTQLHGAGGLLRFESSYRHEQNGQLYPCFNLPKRETLVLLSGYSVVLRHRIVTRWMELEQAGSTVSNLISNPVMAARAWADQFEARQIA